MTNEKEIEQNKCNCKCHETEESKSATADKSDNQEKMPENKE